MALLFGALFLGFLAARYIPSSKVLTKNIGKLGTLSLVVLLFSLGLSLGSNAELMASLPSLGLKALILSLGTIGGSVFLVWLGVKLGRGRS